MIRLFVAIELPEDVRERLAALCSGVLGARWVARENMHISLRFIGEVDEARSEDIALALSAVSAPAFDLSLGGVGRFGNGSAARVLWAEVEKNPALFHLQGKVESALVRAGLDPEGRKFAPHVTLARLKGAPRSRVEAFIADNGLFRARTFAVERFVLFSSFLSRSGAIYTPEAVYPLHQA